MRPAGIRKSVTQTDFSGVSRPSDKEEEGGGLEKFFFRPFGSQFGLKIRGAGPPGPSPGSANGRSETLHLF